MAQKNKADYINAIQDSRTKSYSFIFASIVVLSVLIFGAITPSVVSISKVLGEIEKKKIYNEQLKNKVSALSSLTTEYNTLIKSQEDLLYTTTPPKNDFSAVVVNIESDVREYNLELVSINLNESAVTTATLNTLNPMGISIIVKGEIADVLKFANKINTYPSKPELKSINYSIKEADTKPESYSLLFEFYSLKKEHNIIFGLTNEE